MTRWRDVEQADAELASAGRELLMNCAPTWGIALLGTLRRGGSPRIAPLCVYILDGGLFVTLEGHKENDLRRDARCTLHSYWGEGQDEFSVSGAAWPPLERNGWERLVALEPRLVHSPIIRELSVSSAHSVIYRNFLQPDMYAEVTVWEPGEPPRRWTREESVPEADLRQ